MNAHKPSVEDLPYMKMLKIITTKYDQKQTNIHRAINMYDNKILQQ